MSFDSFDVYFNGDLLPDEDPEQVRTRLATIFKLDDRGVAKLFAGVPVRIKQDVDADRAGSYRERFRRAGALVQIVPHGQQPAAPRTTAAAGQPAPETSAGEAGLELLPPRTGSLADCAPPPPHFDLPDLSAIELAEAGATIDDRERPAPVTIDTADLSMTEAGTGSLEDCHTEAPDRPLPDTDALDLDRPGVTLDERPPPAPADIDTSGLDAAPANTGSLEDCRVEKPAAPIRDTSDLKLVDN